MKKNIKLCSLLIFCLTFTACATQKSNNNPAVSTEIGLEDTAPTISEVHGTYIYDEDSYSELAGVSDYVIIGNVNKEISTEYRRPIEITTESGGTETIGIPYTNYEVQVLENLKGNLVTDRPITITKKGGITEDKSQYILFGSDVMPESGQTYVFYIFAQEDGSNLVSGANSNIPISLSRQPRVSTYSNSIVEDSQDIRKKVEEGIANEVFFELDRSISKDAK
jgi:hypothetical protein